MSAPKSSVPLIYAPFRLFTCPRVVLDVPDSGVEPPSWLIFAALIGESHIASFNLFHLLSTFDWRLVVNLESARAVCVCVRNKASASNALVA